MGALFKYDFGVTEPFPDMFLFVSGKIKNEARKQMPDPIAKNQKMALHPHLDDNPAPIRAPNAEPRT